MKNRIFDKNWILVQIFENNQLKIDPRQNLDPTGVRIYICEFKRRLNFYFVNFKFWRLKNIRFYKFWSTRKKFENFLSLEIFNFFGWNLFNKFPIPHKCFPRQWKHLFLVQQYLRVVLRVFLMVFACSPIISFPFYGFARCLNL